MKFILSILLMFPLSVFAQSNNTNDGQFKNLKKYSKYKLSRTSNDSAILKKYIEQYKNQGGELYIIMLQQKYKPDKTNDSTYTLIITQQDMESNEASPSWSDFLFCPIGKPDGKIIALDGVGNEIQRYVYKNEKKNGITIWFDAANSSNTKFNYVDDILIRK
ncbi:MAG TPA: hypothetical protein VNZ45_01225 [Bacteroidia bacterium]|jgi:hypothetical protein|nr:hypothetical protein [Bacteroidia bacterium]